MWLTILADILGALAKAFFGEEAAVSNEQQVGALTAEQNANAVAIQAVSTRDAVKPLTLAELPAHNPTNDPDFRD